MDYEALKRDVNEIKARNQKVELDKAWETSFTRRFLIALFTYLSIGIYLLAIKVDRPFINAIVPTIGFTLSTLTLPYIKKLWISKKG